MLTFHCVICRCYDSLWTKCWFSFQRKSWYRFTEMVWLLWKIIKNDDDDDDDDDFDDSFEEEFISTEESQVIRCGYSTIIKAGGDQYYYLLNLVCDPFTTVSPKNTIFIISLPLSTELLREMKLSYSKTLQMERFVVWRKKAITTCYSITRVDSWKKTWWDW